MAFKRVTMQDIADACGLSRNTVSKVFNERGGVPEATRLAVLAKARALGYIPGAQHVSVNLPAEHARNIALLACNLPSDFHFCNFFIPAFAERISSFGYTFTVVKITPEELERRVLPAHLSLERTAGLLAIEVFDRAYMDMMCGLGLPTIFVDAWSGAFRSLLRCDVISMENVAGIMAVTDHVISKGARRLGFYGDITHCNSFLERWLGFRMALEQAGLPLDMDMCVIEKNIAAYTDVQWAGDRLRRMKALPDAFICANDYLAIRLMTALKQMGRRIPEDIMITGFDGQPQAAVVDPALTTVQIPSEEIGRLAAQIMLGRIQSPNHPYVFSHVRTTPVFRASTDVNRQAIQTGSEALP